MKGFAGLQCKSSRDEATRVSCWIWFSGSHKTNLTHFISLKQKKRQCDSSERCLVRGALNSAPPPADPVERPRWTADGKITGGWEAHDTKNKTRTKEILVVPGLTHQWLIKFNWINFLFSHRDRITVSLLPNGTRRNQSRLSAQSEITSHCHRQAGRGDAQVQTKCGNLWVFVLMPVTGEKHLQNEVSRLASVSYQDLLPWQLHIGATWLSAATYSLHMVCTWQKLASTHGGQWRLLNTARSVS